MRSPTSLHENRVYGPDNFCSPVQKDFATKSANKRQMHRSKQHRYSIVGAGQHRRRHVDVLVKLSLADSWARACSCRIESQAFPRTYKWASLAASIRLGAEPCRRHILRTFACGLSHASKAGLRDVRQPSSSTSAQVRQSNG